MSANVHIRERQMYDTYAQTQHRSKSMRYENDTHQHTHTQMHRYLCVDSVHRAKRTFFVRVYMSKCKCTRIIAIVEDECNACNGGLCGERRTPFDMNERNAAWSWAKLQMIYVSVRKRISKPCAATFVSQVRVSVSV